MAGQPESRPPKKLEEAARVWAAGDDSNPTPAEDDAPNALAQDLAAWGLCIEVEAPDHISVDRRFEVWPENWPTLELFDRLGTQWRWDGMSGKCLGLNYGGVETLLRLEAVADQARVFADIQTMERAALAVMNRGKAS